MRFVANALFLLVTISAIVTLHARDEASVYSWKAGYGVAYPEKEMLDAQGKTDSAAAFSGGGLRAYMSTLGYLRGLLDLGLLNRTRYLSAVSGGSWAVSAYVWHDATAAKTPEQFLGDVYPPHELSLAKLRYMNRGSARKMPVKLDLIIQALWDLVSDFDNPVDVWYRAISEVFLRPAGIGWRTLFTWNRDTLADILRRNPWLGDYEFALPCGGKQRCDNIPFPVINTAILGPQQASPFDIFHLGYTALETTPLYIGSPNSHNFTYRAMSGPFNIDAKSSPKFEMRYGGFVEPFGFGGFATVEESVGEEKVLPGPFFGMGPKETKKLLTVPRPKSQFTLANATGTSSWAPGSLLAELGVISDVLNKYIGLESSYWSPVTPSQDAPVLSTKVLLADGGALDNQGLIAMLRRKVQNIVVFVTTPVPLKPRSQYNPFTRFPRDDDIDSGVSAFFGYFDLVQSPLAYVANNQVFSRYSFPFLIDKLQRAQSRGNGIVAKTKLVTVRNDWWGIEAGHEVNVAWVYLGRAFNWERRLPLSLQKLVVPENSSDPTAIPTSGIFEGFPYLPTSKLNYRPEQANLLANLAHWVIVQNAHIFKEMMG